MTQTTAPTLQMVKDFLGLTEPEDTYDDLTLTAALEASLQAQCVVVCYPTNAFGEVVWTDDLVMAIYLRTQRLAARRNSPEGVVGLSGIGGDFVSARVPSWDGDVLALESPYRKIPSG